MAKSWKNHLYYGDNLDVLRKYIKDESIDLCYIDPPFNSKRNYNQIYNNIGSDDKAQAQAFIDTWTWDDQAIIGFEQIISNHNNVFTKKSIQLIIGLEKVLGKGDLFAYLVHLTLRIAEIFRVLKSTGSFYLHCDPTASHYIKLICDSVFCANGGDFKSEIIWRRTGAHNKSERYAPIHDVILFYVKSDNYTWNKPRIPYMQGHVEEYFIKENGGYRTNYYGNVLTGSGVRGGESGLAWKGINPTSKGRHWAIPGKLVDEVGEDFSNLTQHEKLDRLFDLGYIKFIEGDCWPIYEHRIDPFKHGPAMPDIWSYQPYTIGTVFGRKDCIDEDVRWLSTKDAERLGYPTQKPEGLLARIIAASSNQGDIILDAYCGCGTTVTVSEQLQRQWIGIDITYQSISLILKRLEDTFGKMVLEGIELNGIPEDFESAVALAHKKDDKTRKEFEKWAVLTYSNNRAIINEKKGGDHGIDGIAFMQDRDDNSDIIIKEVLFSVKSDKTPLVSFVRDLHGTVVRESAAMGYLITLYPPTTGMIKECKRIGNYKNKLMDKDYPKITLITVAEILSGMRMTIPMGNQISVLKSAKSKKRDTQTRMEM